jgi:hypothetical protein
MKILKLFVMAMMAILMSVGFVACDSDDDNINNSVNLKGRWYSKTETLRNLLIINDDNSVVAYRVYNYESRENISGALTIKGNSLSITFEDGNHVSGTFALSNNTLTINTSNGNYTYSRLADETNMVGKWNYSNITFSAKPVKDEIVIPGGTVNGEVVPPTIMQTSQISGEFINYAAQRYFRDVVFKNDGTFTYNVLTNGEELPMTKNYSIEGLSLTVSGETAQHDIESTFRVLQSFDNNTVFFVFDKEDVANMFIGYALMLFEGGVAPEVTDEALENYKKAFVEAFDYYSVEFIMTRAE